LRVEEELAGNKVRCRGCSRVVIAPLLGDDPGFRIVQRGVDVDALRVLTPSTPRPKRKWGWGIGIGIVAIAFVVLGWYALFPGEALPPIVGDLPEGDAFFYRSSRGAEFLRSGSFPFDGAREVVTLNLGTRTLTVYGGEFSLAAISDGLKAREYLVLPESLFQHPREDETIWLSSSRIALGPRSLVEEFRNPKAPRFLHSLTVNQRRTLDRLPLGDLLYFEKATRENSILPVRIAGGSAGMGFALRLRSAEEGDFTMAIGGANDFESQRARSSLMELMGLLEEFRLESKPGVASALGRLSSLRLTWRSNEAAAIRSLNRLGTAQSDYRRAHGRFAHSLAELHQEGATDGGYRLRLNATDAGFVAWAVPAQARITGQFTFVTNETGLIYRKEIEGEPVTPWPADPLSDGWTRLGD